VLFVLELYRASAGSGKTYTLVLKYLELVLKDPDTFKHVLGITFTNKAAAEMKERILLALKDLSKGEARKLENELQGKLPATRQNVKLHSSELLTQLLHNYSDFSLMTIDSFIHRVLRAFALEIGLPLTFSIELNYERLYTYVMERLINQVGHDEFITRIILDFVHDRLREGKSWNIEGDIRKFVGELFNEKNIDWAKEVGEFGPGLLEDYRRQLNAYQGDFLRKMRELGGKAIELIREAGLEVTDFSYGSNGSAGFFEVCRGLDERTLSIFELRKRFVKEEWYSKKAPQDVKARIEALLAGGLAQTRQRIIEVYQSDYPKALTAHFMLETLYPTALLSQIKQLIEEYKTRHNVVPISEFNIKVYEIVKYSPVPFIYAVLGERFNHYLIDEFQDTSRMQWANLYPLVENALASGHKCLTVGDGKQAIYRWRGGDVEIMEWELKQGPLGPYVKRDFLEDNWRSRQKIIHFNNKFFDGIRDICAPENPLLAHIYHEASQFDREKKGGLVSLQFIPETSRQEESDPMVFDCVNAIVKDCLEQGGYCFGDMAVLVRTKKEGRKIAEHLLEQGHRVLSPDSLVLARVPLIRFLIDVLTYLDNPGDRIARSCVIYYLCLHQAKNPMEPTTIGNFIMTGEDRLFKVFPELEIFFRVRDFLIRMPVYEVLEEVIRIFKLSESLDFNTAAYLQAFLNIVSGYSTEHNVDFSSFLDWWESNREEFALEVPETADAVTIMTIHKAKGLEFPVVIIPYADWKHELDRELWLNPDQEQLKLEPPLYIPMPIKRRKALNKTLFEKELLKEAKKVEIDNVNLLYVAFTRAVDRLYIIARKEKTTTQKENNNHRSNVQLLRDKAVPLMETMTDLEDCYTLGDAQPKEITRPAETDLKYEAAEQLLSNRWYDKISIRRKATEFWRFDREYLKEKRSWGILVHQVMARIAGAQDVEAAVKEVFHAGDIDANEQEELNRKLQDIFEIETVKEWFDPKYRAFTESSIITDQGVLRPDRVVIHKDHVIIVDFKTGQHRKSHANQLQTYKQAIQQMGYHNVDAYILYIETKEILPV
jgi:ATP-dependent exoDNAse (exonuclease V) beta subunit